MEKIIIIQYNDNGGKTMIIGIENLKEKQKEKEESNK